MTDLNIGTVYKSMWEGIKELPTDLQAEIYNTIFEYQFTGIEPEIENVIVRAIFISHKPSIDNMIAKQRAQIENGKKGGRPKTQNNPTETQQNPNKTQNNPTETQQNPNKTQNNPTKPNETQAKARVKSKDIRVKKVNKEKESKEKENNLPAQTAVPDSFSLEIEPTKPKPKPAPNTPQGRIYDYFANKYQIHTGIKYFSKKDDFVNLAKLINQYSEQQVRQKIDWLEVGCSHSGVFWFAKDFSDFTIGTLRTHWNHILPKLTDEQRKEQAKRRKQEEIKKQVIAELAKDGLKLADTETKEDNYAVRV